MVVFLLMKMRDDDPLKHNAEQILAAAAPLAAALTRASLLSAESRYSDSKPVNVNDIITRMKGLLSRIIGEDIELRIAPAARDLIVLADAGQLEQVLMNFTTNARDAMADGGLLTIEAELLELDEEYIKTHAYGEPGKYAVVSMTDTGAGMDEEVRKRIFEPFYTTKELGKGAGLGLAMVYGIIKTAHKGHINVYSELGKGTTFKIYLPIVEAVVAEETRSMELTGILGGVETILLAEDDAEVRKLTKNVLEEFGYTVIEAEDGEEALNKFTGNEDSVRLLLLDVMMPKKNGREVYKEIRRTHPAMKSAVYERLYRKRHP